MMRDPRTCSYWINRAAITVFSFSPAFELLPGDEIAVRCEFQSLTQTQTTYYGEATSDEMCFGIMAYYPAVPKFTYCGQWRTVGECSNEAAYVCDLEQANVLWSALEYVCADASCSDACTETLRLLIATGCMSDDAGKYLLSWYPELQQVYDLQNFCAIKATSRGPGCQPSWSFSTAVLIVTSYSLSLNFL